MKPLLFCLALLAPIFSNAQFCPKGAEWSYYLDGFGSGFEGVKYVSDTLINGLWNKKLVVSSSWTQPWGSTGSSMEFRFIHQQNDSIFNEKSELLFRTNLTVGEWLILKGANAAMPFDSLRIDSFQVKNYGSTAVKTFFGTWINKAWFLTDAPILIHDRFGPQNGFHFLQDFYYQALDGPLPYLLCYSDSLMTTRLDGLSCSTVGTSEQVTERVQISLSPNPTTDFLTISTKTTLEKPLLVRLFDAAGKAWRVEEMRLPSSISVSELPSGLYFLQVGEAAAQSFFKN